MAVADLHLRFCSVWHECWHTVTTVVEEQVQEENQLANPGSPGEWPLKFGPIQLASKIGKRLHAALGSHLM